MITHPEKVLFPDDGISKGELAAYYETIAPTLLPHLAAVFVAFGGGTPARPGGKEPVASACS